MENGKEPIYPDPMRGAEQSFTNQSPHDLPIGLTKREYFAGLAMQGMLATGYGDFNDNRSKYTAELAVKQADALLAELDKPKQE